MIQLQEHEAEGGKEKKTHLAAEEFRPSCRCSLMEDTITYDERFDVEKEMSFLVVCSKHCRDHEKDQMSTQDPPPSHFQALNSLSHFPESKTGGMSHFSAILPGI